MNRVPFNINHNVFIKVTPRGKRIYEDNFIALGLKPTPLKVDENGWTKMQLWEVMQYFGVHCYHGCEVPFETVIKFEVEVKQ